VARLPDDVHAGLEVEGESVLIVSVEEGVGFYHDGAHRLQVAAGDVLITAPAAVHDMTGLGTVTGWSVEFSPHLLGLLAQGVGQLRPSPEHPNWLSFIRPACPGHGLALPHDLRMRWQSRGQLMLAEAQHRRPGYYQVLLSQLTLTLIDVSRLVYPSQGPDEIHDEPIVAAMFDYIEAHFDEPISLDDVADAIAVSSGHLARLAKRSTRRTVNEWILERRMAEARRLLLLTNDKIGVIARCCGFSDASYFRRRFRTSHGCSPGEWRAQPAVSVSCPEWSRSGIDQDAPWQGSAGALAVQLDVAPRR